VSYDEAVQYLYSLRLFGAKFGLDNTFKLAALAGQPQARLQFIHVAGTNGKGSTCAMLESIYRAAGLRVGLFTSPHLVSFRERIQVNRQLIPEAEVARLVAELRGLPAMAKPNFSPTFFEFVTVVALTYFAAQKCDLVIWETGLGGRLDATNIVTPLASVITNIAFDHQQWLGDTLAKIAAEKAGIIKPRVPVITATEAPEALRVIAQTAAEKAAPLTVVQAGDAARLARPTLLGGHQKINAALALAAVKILQPQIPVADAALRAGLASVNWPGRLQVIRRPGGKTILLDGAHNIAGATVLRAALEKEFAGAKPVLIFGALADKKWFDICTILSSTAHKILCVPVASERTAAAAELAAAFRAAAPNREIRVLANVAEALNASKDEPFVLITGSLYLVGEALERLACPPSDRSERGLNEWTAAKISR